MENGTENYRRYREEGDESGLIEIIREYREGLTLYLNGIVGNMRDAEELCEDTFVLLGTKKPRDKGKGAFRTWLYTIGRNLAIDWLRRRQKRREVPEEEAGGIASPERIEEGYVKKEQGILVQRAMGRLSADHRQVLTLIYYEGHTARETAAAMKRSVRSIESLLYRAKKQLKTELEKEGFEYENT